MTRRILPPSPGNLGLDDRLRAALAVEREAKLERRCPTLTGRSGLRYTLEGREVLSFCSNDYLGLADQRIEFEAPSGAAASRLVCGELPEHRALERRFAAWLGYEDALLFPSGFQANVCVPAALLRAGDEVHSDALNHASLIDGLRLAPAKVSIRPHLEAPPSAAYERPGASDAWWVIESSFSMDGDGPARADLDTHLARGGCLYLDEAHAIGLHAKGRGRAGGMRHRPTILVAPLGKAFGCAGAFVCASSTVCDYLRGHARGFVFTTGVSPALLPRIERAFELIAGPQGDARREQLWRNVEAARQLLGLPGTQASPILPLVVGTNERALELSARLLERGWHVQAIRPPTVPASRARLRITISAAHEPGQIEQFAADLRELMAA